MYIKEIAVENFKSYRRRHVITLHQGHNVLFGRNGSGKSNIGSALALIFSASRQKLTKVERESLINTDSQASFAAIEVNICTESETTEDFALKRVITKKSDQFFFNNLAISHARHYDYICQNFIPDCPFYLVFQGDIENWTTYCSKGDHLLDTFSKVLGVTDIDQIFIDSVKTIAAEKEKQNEIKTELSALELKVAKDGEKFNGWNCANKERRFLEHKLLDLTRISLETELEDLEEPLEEEKKKILEAENRFWEAEEVFIKAGDEYDAMEQAKKRQTKVLERLEGEKREIHEELAFLAEEVKNLEEKLQLGVEFPVLTKKQKFQEEIMALTAKRTSLERQFHEAKELHARKFQDYAENRSKIAAASRKVKIATEIQDGGDVSAAIAKIVEQIQVQQEAVEVEKTEVSHLEENKIAEERKLAKKHENIDEIRKNLSELKRKKIDLGKSRNELLENQKRLQKESAELHELIEMNLRENIKLRKDLNFYVRPEILEGIFSVDKILEKWKDEERVHDVEGVFGLVLENFKPEGAVTLAAEVAADDRLFHFIVRDRDLILKFEKELQELPGIVSFIPLSNVHCSKVNYPADSQGIPLISRIDFSDEETEEVIKSIFSRTVIVRNLAKGAELVRNHPHLKFITLQGSQVLSQGHFRSGFRDSSISRIKIFQQFRKSTEELNAQKKKYKKINHSLERLRQNLLEVMNALQKIDLEIFQEDEKLSQLLREIPQISKDLNISAKNYESGSLFLEELRAGLEALEVTRDDLESNLDALEPSILRKSINDLEIENQRQKKIIHESAKKIEELENELKNIDLELIQNENLLRNLEEEPEELPLDEIHKNLDTNRRKIEELEENSRIIDADLEQGAVRLERLEQKMIENRKVLREARFDKIILENDLKSAKIEEELIISQMNKIREKLMELEEQEQNMTTIPNISNAEEFEEYSRKQLERRIQKLKQKEASFGNVLTLYHAELDKNLKEIRKTKELLEKTQQKIRNMEQTINETREKLNVKKFETLDWAFKSLNKKFRQIFRRIVEVGEVRLYPVNSNGKRIQSETILWENVSNLKIEASFFEERHMDDLLKLSGGQKTIIGLSLLLAIETISMAPFFYFDEVDRALDDEWRELVADLLKNFSKAKQAISITFRKEFLNVADKFFKVSTVNGCSRIVESNQDEAVRFVEKSAAEAES